VKSEKGVLLMKRVIDLTIGYAEDMMVASESERPKIERTNDYEPPSWYRIHNITYLYYHIGTHTDAPSHYIRGGKNLDEINPELFCGDAIILDLSFRGSNEAITVEDVKTAEKKLITGIKPKDMILLMTKWSSQKWGKKEYFATSPYLQRDAAEYLIKKNPRALGYDFVHERYSNLRRPTGADELKKDVWIWRPIHMVVLSAGIYHVEHLINLEKVGTERFEIVVAPILFHGLEGAPTRVFAIEKTKQL
jgi:kynurenine formamidase